MLYPSYKPFDAINVTQNLILCVTNSLDAPLGFINLVIIDYDPLVVKSSLANSF